VTLTYELHNVKANNHVKYLVQRSSSSNVIDQKHTQTSRRVPTATPGPPKWSVNMWWHRSHIMLRKGNRNGFWELYSRVHYLYHAFPSNRDERAFLQRQHLRPQDVVQAATAQPRQTNVRPRHLDSINRTSCILCTRADSRG